MGVSGGVFTSGVRPPLIYLCLRKLIIHHFDQTYGIAHIDQGLNRIFYYQGGKLGGLGTGELGVGWGGGGRISENGRCGHVREFI